MEAKTTINAYTLIGMSSKNKVAEMLGMSVPTLRQKLNGSISWTLEDVDTLKTKASMSNMRQINETVRFLNK